MYALQACACVTRCSLARFSARAFLRCAAFSYRNLNFTRPFIHPKHLPRKYYSQIAFSRKVVKILAQRGNQDDPTRPYTLELNFPSCGRRFHEARNHSRNKYRSITAAAAGCFINTFWREQREGGSLTDGRNVFRGESARAIADTNKHINRLIIPTRRHAYIPGPAFYVAPRRAARTRARCLGNFLLRGILLPSGILLCRPRPRMTAQVRETRLEIAHLAVMCL